MKLTCFVMMCFVLGFLASRAYRYQGDARPVAMMSEKERMYQSLDSFDLYDNNDSNDSNNNDDDDGEYDNE